jgi:hypothetical protein
MNTMLMPDARDQLELAHERGRRFRDEAASERMRGRSGTRRALAASLRRAADRLDPAPLGWRSVLR